MRETVSKLLAAFLLMGGVAVILAVAILPAKRWAQRTHHTNQELHKAQNALANSIRKLELEKADLTGKSDLGSLWTANHVGEATAQVQSKIADVASRYGFSIRSISPLPPKDLELAIAVGFLIESEASLDQIVPFLEDIEYHTPPLIIESATIRRVNPVGEKGVQPFVTFQLLIMAPFLIEEPK